MELPILTSLFFFLIISFGFLFYFSYSNEMKTETQIKNILEDKSSFQSSPINVFLETQLSRHGGSLPLKITSSNNFDNIIFGYEIYFYDYNENEYIFQNIVKQEEISLKKGENFFIFSFPHSNKIKLNYFFLENNFISNQGSLFFDNSEFNSQFLICVNCKNIHPIYENISSTFLNCPSFVVLENNLNNYTITRNVKYNAFENRTCFLTDFMPYGNYTLTAIPDIQNYSVNQIQIDSSKMSDIIVKQNISVFYHYDQDIINKIAHYPLNRDSFFEVGRFRDISIYQIHADSTITLPFVEENYTSFLNSTVFISDQNHFDRFPFSISFWIRFNNQVNRDRHVGIIKRQNDIIDPGWSITLFNDTLTSRYIVSDSTNSIGFNETFSLGITGLNKTGWNHLVYTFNSTGAYVFLNKNLIRSELKNIDEVTFNQITTIGNGHVANSFFRGDLSSIRFYSKTLSSEEITNIYNEEANLFS